MTRCKERIDLVMKLINIEQFIKDLGVFTDESDLKSAINEFKNTKSLLTGYWKEEPDLRLTQLLVKHGIIPNTEGFWFYIEEDEYLIKNQKIDPAEVKFWGQRMDGKGKRLREDFEPVFKPIKELNTDHIKKILEHQRLNPKYKKYFEDELNKRELCKNLT